jgi:hypothetical protein
MTTHNMTIHAMYKHPTMPISASMDAHIGTLGCQYEHPAMPIFNAFLQVRRLRRLRPLSTSKELGTRGAVRAALRSSRKRSGPRGDT